MVQETDDPKLIGLYRHQSHHIANSCSLNTIAVTIYCAVDVKFGFI
jgi:hypothetical protein